MAGRPVRQYRQRGVGRTAKGPNLIRPLTCVNFAFNSAEFQAKDELPNQVVPLGGAMIRAFILGTSLFALSACSTTSSFAPPPVKVTYIGYTDTWPECGAHRDTSTQITVNRDVDGALRLADGFIHAYRCSAHAAANGRQIFEIPAFLATTGAATAVALGGGATYGIVGTTANAAFTAGNSYWGPKQKAAMYDHALDALLCIRNEAVGADPAKFEAETAKQRVERGPKVEVSPEVQYFALVSTAAFSVERILSQRLSNMAAPDGDAAAAKLTAAIEAILKAQQDKKDLGNKDGPGIVQRSGETPERAKERAMIEIDLKELKGKLDKCIVRASL